MNKKKILLIYPSSKHTKKQTGGLLGLIWRKDYKSPRELIEISIQLPVNWERTLIDQSFEPIRKQDLEWADLIIIKADEIQEDATLKIIDRCASLNKIIVATGSLFEHNQALINKVDYIVSNSEDFYKFSEEYEENKACKIFISEQKRVLEYNWLPDYSMRNFLGVFLRNIQLFSS